MNTSNLSPSNGIEPPNDDRFPLLLPTGRERPFTGAFSFIPPSMHDRLNAPLLIPDELRHRDFTARVLLIYPAPEDVLLLDLPVIQVSNVL